MRASHRQKGERARLQRSCWWSRPLPFGTEEMALGPRVQLPETRSSGSQRWVHLGGEAPESWSTSHKVICLTPSPSDWVCAATCLLLGLVAPGLPLRNRPSLSRSKWLRLGSPSASPTLHAHTQMHTRTHAHTCSPTKTPTHTFTLHILPHLRLGSRHGLLRKTPPGSCRGF